MNPHASSPWLRHLKPVLGSLLWLALMAAPLVSLPHANAKVSRQLPAAASSDGKYQQLLSTVVSCAEERANDEANYAEDGDAGYYPRVKYCGTTQPAGYWVYVSPTWYIWKNKDLSAIGYQSLSQTVVLKEQTVTLQFEHQQKHQGWAKENLIYVARALQDMEALTGIPYPGVNPYVIEERPKLTLLGQAGPSGMVIQSPPKGTPWTFLHEVVHIWNAGQRPSWISEGQANFLSFLLMQQNGFPFIGEETYAEYIRAWRSIQGSTEDLPLQNHYDDLPQGKAMAWWAMVYELYGPAVITEIFQALHQQSPLPQAELERILRKYSGKDPRPLLSGWVLPGTYQVQRSADFGPVRYPLKQAWPESG